MTLSQAKTKVRSRWLTAIDSEQMIVKIEFFKGYAFLHCTLRQRAKGLRAARQALPLVKGWLRRMGHRCVYACVPPEQVSYAEHFGFKRMGKFNGSIFLIQEC